MTLNPEERRHLTHLLEGAICHRPALAEYLRGLTSPAGPDEDDDAVADLLAAATTSDARLEVLSDAQLLRLANDPALLLALAEEVSETYLPAWGATFAGGLSPPAPLWEALALARGGEATETAPPADLGQVAQAPEASPGGQARVLDWEWDLPLEDLDWETGKEGACPMPRAGRRRVHFRIQAFARREQRAGYWNLIIRGFPAVAGEENIRLTIFGEGQRVTSSPLPFAPARGVPWEGRFDSLGDPTKRFAHLNLGELNAMVAAEGAWRWQHSETIRSPAVTRGFYEGWLLDRRRGYESVAKGLVNWLRPRVGPRAEELARQCIERAADQLLLSRFVLSNIGSYADFSDRIFHRAKQRYIDEVRRRPTVPVLEGDATVPTGGAAEAEGNDLIASFTCRLSHRLQREVLRLTYEENLDTPAIAERLGVTPNRVRVERSRAYQELRRQMQAEGRLLADYLARW